MKIIYFTQNKLLFAIYIVDLLKSNFLCSIGFIYDS